VIAQDRPIIRSALNIQALSLKAASTGQPVAQLGRNWAGLVAVNSAVDWLMLTFWTAVRRPYKAAIPPM
jgi:hypothetical protein